MMKTIALKLALPLGIFICLAAIAAGCGSGNATIRQKVTENLLGQSETGQCATAVGYPFAVRVTNIDDGAPATKVIELASNRLSRTSFNPIAGFNVEFVTVTGELSGPKGKAPVIIYLTKPRKGSVDVDIERVDVGNLLP